MKQVLRQLGAYRKDTFLCIGMTALEVVMDILLAVCAFFNAIILVKVARRGIEAFHDYRRQKKEGIEEPVFHKSCLSDPTGVTEWD